jgi:hypothetical protein
MLALGGDLFAAPNSKTPAQNSRRMPHTSAPLSASTAAGDVRAPHIRAPLRNRATTAATSAQESKCAVRSGYSLRPLTSLLLSTILPAPAAVTPPRSSDCLSAGWPAPSSSRWASEPLSGPSPPFLKAHPCSRSALPERGRACMQTAPMDELQDE